MAVVDDSDAVSRFEAALAAHRRLNAREDALADAQRAALERAESHDLAPPTPPVQASELQQLLDEFEAHAPAEETKTSAPPPKRSGGSGGGVYGRAARRNANQGTSRDEYGDPGPALEAISDAAATAARVTGDGLELAAKGVAVAAGATVAVVVGAAAAAGAAAVEGAKVAGPAIRDAANATAEITSDAVEAAGPILQDAADATVEAAGRAADVAGPVIRDAAGLAWVANLGCLDLNPHPVRAEDLDHPDELRIDLDPMPGVEWAQIVDVAFVARDVLDDVGLHAREEGVAAATEEMASNSLKSPNF